MSVNLDICDAWLRRNVVDYQREDFETAAKRAWVSNVLDYLFLFYRHRSVAARLQQDGCDAFLQRVSELAAQGRGVIIICAHLANTEYIGLVLSRIAAPVSVVYSPQRNRWLDKKLLQLRRDVLGLNMCPATTSGVRQILSALRRGHVVVMLADQKPRRSGSSGVASFMGADALSPVLLPSLARRTGAAALGLAVVQSDGGRALQVLSSSVSADLSSDDVSLALTAQNRAVEELILQAPAQYMWTYRRYGRTPDREHNPYRR